MNNIILKILLKVLLCLILVLSLLQIKMKYGWNPCNNPKDSIPPIVPTDTTGVVPIDTTTIDLYNNLVSEGYLSISLPEGVKAQMYVSPNLKANSELIDWDKVTTFITSNDTLYPKKDSKIFIHAFTDKKTISTYNSVYEFTFNMKEFVQLVLLKFTNNEKLGNVAKNMLYNVSEKRPIIFDIGGGMEPIVLTSIYDLKQIPDFLSQDVENFKIDSLDFYPYSNLIKKPQYFQKNTLA